MAKIDIYAPETWEATLSKMTSKELHDVMVWHLINVSWLKTFKEYHDIATTPPELYVETSWEHIARRISPFARADLLDRMERLRKLIEDPL